MERVEIAELFYNAFINLNDLEKLARFLSARVQLTLSGADPHTAGEESPPNAIKFYGKEGCRQLALYFHEKLEVSSGDFTGCISHHHLVFVFGTLRLGGPVPDQFAETNIAARLTFHGSKIIKGPDTNFMAASLLSLMRQTKKRALRRCDNVRRDY